MKRTRVIINLTGALAMWAAASGSVHAQSFYGSINPSATIQSVVDITVTSNSPTTITFNNSSDYAGSYSVTNFNTIQVKSNRSWTLAISSGTPYFTNSGSYSTANMPASVLEYGIVGQSAKVTLTGSPQTLKSGNNGSNSEPGNTFNVSFTARPGYNYGPGTYTISTIYTLSAQ